MNPDPLSRVFAALLVIGAAGYVFSLFARPAYFKSIPRGVAIVTRVLYCAVAAGFLSAAYLEFRGWRDLTISYTLMCSIFLNLIVVLIERHWFRRSKRSMSERH